MQQTLHLTPSRLKKRRAKLITATEEAFAHIKRMPTEHMKGEWGMWGRGMSCYVVGSVKVDNSSLFYYIGKTDLDSCYTTWD